MDVMTKRDAGYYSHRTQSFVPALLVRPNGTDHDRSQIITLMEYFSFTDHYLPDNSFQTDSVLRKRMI